jgi:hypothetical protein
VDTVAKQMLWGVSGGVPFRRNLTWGQAARLMQAQMQPLLWEVCAMRCSYGLYTGAIHGIRRLVDGICRWQEAAVVAGAASAAAARAEAEAEAARAVVTSRHLEAFETVTVVARPAKGEREKETPPAVILLTVERREALRQVVKEMRMNVFPLKEDVRGYNPDKLALIESVVGYQESCCDDNTWVWNAEAWVDANRVKSVCMTWHSTN